ncbi:MAG: sulfate ABC transporter substrate-binding protein [Leptospira sp.]|nr:sulfate ABC transporter substrate-binding protein [Leptospira sp.]
MLVICLIFISLPLFSETSLLNVSFDPTRELYDELNQKFSETWKLKTKEEIKIQQSHGGSGKQARSVIDGLQADVVTLALAFDIDNIATKSTLVEKNWEKQFPNSSVPYYSTIIFLVRKGNPKQIKDWDDLIKPGVSIITPNPKTSGGARWNYLAAYGFAKRKFNSEDKAREFIKKIYQNTSILDTGARASTTTFVKRGIGDVLISWENEAELAIAESNKNGKADFEIVYPKESIKAETPVAIVTGVAKKKGTLLIAKSYLEFLYTKEGQEIVAKHFFRPIDASVFKKHSLKFPNIKLFTIHEIEGNWSDTHKKHFSDGGLFDLIYVNSSKK